MGHGICEGWGHQPSQFREAGRTKGTDRRSAQGRCQNRPGEDSSVTLMRGGGEGKKEAGHSGLGDSERGWGRRAWQPTSVSLPGESRGQRSLVGYR